MGGKFFPPKQEMKDLFITSPSRSTIGVTSSLIASAEGAREARLDDGCAERRPFANLNAAAAAAVVEPRC